MRSLLLGISLFFSYSTQAIIFGTDDRKDVILDSAIFANQAPSVAMSVGNVYFLPQKEPDKFSLDFALASLNAGLGLCPQEKFAKQAANWINCTGFLVAEDILVTAGHCMVFSHGKVPEVTVNTATNMCQNFSWMFDYNANSTGLVPLINYGVDQVYKCTNVIYAEISGNKFAENGTFIPPQNGEYGIDYAIIKLDRKVPRPILKMATSSPVKGESIYALGFPSGLPQKISANSQVFEDQYKNFFTTDLDVVGGSSGGPVFNSQNEVVGLVVRASPDEDYVYDEKLQCSRNNVCAKIDEGSCTRTPESKPLGTHVQRMDPIVAKLKELGLVQ